MISLGGITFLGRLLHGLGREAGRERRVTQAWCTTVTVELLALPLCIAVQHTSPLTGKR